MNVLMLSAGLGTRLRPYTEKMPKPAIPFLSAPMIAYNLALIDEIDVDNLVVNTHHLPQLMETATWQLNPACKKLIFSNEPQILGSGGGMQKAFPYLAGKGDFLVVNADNLVLPHHLGIVKDLIQFHQSHKGIATSLVIEHPGVGIKFGGLWSKDLVVERAAKTPMPGLKGFHYIGVTVLSERIQNYFLAEEKEEDFLYHLMARAIASGETFYAFPCSAEWFETGNVEDFKQATETCLKGLQQNPRPYWAEHLNQVIQKYGRQEPLIENQFPQLKSAVTDAIKAL